jgi:hypothetical protein
MISQMSQEYFFAQRGPWNELLLSYQINGTRVGGLYSVQSHEGRRLSCWQKRAAQTHLLIAQILGASCHLVDESYYLVSEDLACLPLVDLK